MRTEPNPTSGRAFFRAGVGLLVLVMFASACGGDVGDGGDAADTSTDAAELDISQAAGTLGDPNLSLVVDELADGFGNLGRSQERAIQGAADGGEVCDHVAGPRAQPAAFQIEVEVVTVVDGCLHFGYGLANFRSLVADIERRRSGDDVIAVSPLLLDYRLNQIESEWPIEAVDGLAVLDLETAPTGQGITVAIIDSGIDLTHPSIGEVTVRRSPDSGKGDYTETGHGTIAASVIVSPMGSSRRGIAPNVELLDVPADLCEPSVCSCDPCAPMTPAEAIRWAADNGADIISMSFGYQPAPKPAWWQLLLDAEELQSAVDTIEVALSYADRKGIAMTAAAGNCAGRITKRCETEDQYEIPAGHLAVIGVGALASDDEGLPTRAWYSTRQPYVELAAPGDLLVMGSDEKVLEKSGTSYATPFVSAALAVLIGSDGPLEGQPSPAALARQILIDTAADLAPEGRDTSFGHGQLQLQKAVQAARSYAAANPPPTPTATPITDS